MPAVPASKPSALTRRGLLIVALVAVIAAGVGFAIGVPTGAASRKAVLLAAASNRIASTTVTPVVIAPIVQCDGAALKRRLLPPPPGAVLRNVAADRISVPGAATANLQLTIGSTAVATADWDGSDAVEVRTSLVQFASATEAISFVSDTDTELTGADHLVIPGINACFADDATGFDASGRHVSTLLCADGTIAIAMSTFTPGEVDDNAGVRRLQQQIDALAG
jgi:hypothetical protein